MSLETMNQRLQYFGGNQQQRMIKDKLRTLKKALLYSYQAATAILPDGREFRCLINPDKNKPAYDNKILSIPYKDICLNAEKVGKRTQGQVETNIKTGDVFTWKQTNTHWLVYLEFLEEDAYFRSEIRRCDQEVQVNGKKYWTYIRGPVETDIQWAQKAGIEWNSLNYSLVMYITVDENTQEYFERFKTIKIFNPSKKKEKTWQVAGVDPYYGDGIIQIFLNEYFENSIQNLVSKTKEEEEKQVEENNKPQEGVPYIEGPTEVKQFSKARYQIKNANGGKWLIKWKDQEQDLKSQRNPLSLDISVDDLDTFILIYRIEDKEDIELEIKIISL